MLDERLYHRLLILILVLLLLWQGRSLWLSWTAANRPSVLTPQIEEAKKQVSDLEEQVKSATQPATIEKRIRNELRWVLPGEMRVQIVDK